MVYLVLLKKEGEDTGRWTGDLKVDGDLASNCDLLAEFQLTLPETKADDVSRTCQFQFVHTLCN